MATLNNMNNGQRHEMADFESLVYSLWSVAGMNRPKGLNLAELANMENATVQAKVKVSS